MVDPGAVPPWAEIAAGATLLLAAIGEWRHRARHHRVARLVFGPAGRARPWTRVAGPLRAIGLAAVAWGLVSLLLLPPRVHRAKTIDEDDYRHLVLILDVSPSMRLADAGGEQQATRVKRVAELMESFFARVVMAHVRLSVIAVYTEAKPVVIDTKDLDVCRNIMSDLPMHHAFPVGKTDLLKGLREAARVARPWKAGSTTLVLVSDGDSVSPSGMPRMPPSVSEVLVVGVGDPRTGKFIDGHLSRQDTPTLRQIARRLGGMYHDGNTKHIPTDTLRQLSGVALEDPGRELTRREYALLAVTLGALVLALLPLLLTRIGVALRPGVRGLSVRGRTAA